MKSSLENLLSNQLGALLLPPEATEHRGLTVVISIFFLSGIALLIGQGWRYWQRRNTPQETAKRQINALLKTSDASIASHHKAIELTRLLRQGLQVTRLDEHKPEDSQRWKSFHSQLNSLCYSTHRDNKINDQNSLNRLFEESLVWLSPRNNKR